VEDPGVSEKRIFGHSCRVDIQGKKGKDIQNKIVEGKICKSKITTEIFRWVTHGY
jgi:hypothetical protein